MNVVNGPNQNAQWSKLLEKSSTVSRHRPCEMGIPLCYNTQSLFNIQCGFFCLLIWPKYWPINVTIHQL